MTIRPLSVRSPGRGRFAAVSPLAVLVPASLLLASLLAAAPAGAVDAVLGLVPVVPIVEEGGTLELDVVIELPQECRSVDVVVGLELRLVPTVLDTAPEDFASLLIDGRPFAGFPARFVIRREGLRGLVVRRVELRTADDGLVEALEDAFIEVRVDPAVRGSLFCQLQDGSRIDLDLVAGRTRGSVAIEDNDSTRSGRTLVGADNAPRHPLVRRGVTGLRLVVFEGIGTDQGSAVTGELDDRTLAGAGGPLAGLFARLLDRRGAPVAPTRKLSALDPGASGFRPAVAPLPDGGFYVVFVEAAQLGERISGLRVRPDGSLGAATVILPFSLDLIGHVKAAADRLGRIVVTVQPADGLGDARLLIIDADGRLVFSRTFALPSGAQLARTPLGDTVVVFSPEAGGILARVLARDGSLGPLVVVDGDASATLPVVAASSRGFVVVWTRGAANALWARLLERDGTPGGPAFRVGESPIRDGASPSVATNSVGDFVVAWESDAPAAAARSGAAERLGAASAGGASIVSRGWTPDGVAATEEEVVVESEQGSDPANPDVSLDDDDQVTVVFERQGPGGESEEIAEIELDQPIAPGVCSGDPQALCVTDQRFEIRASWDDGQSSGGAATAAPLTGDTGSFWFFDADNVELVVKVLDACSFAGTEWVFAAGLTDVAVELTVTDVVTGVTRTYFNAPGPFAPIQDTSAFECSEGDPPPEGDVLDGVAAHGAAPDGFASHGVATLAEAASSREAALREVAAALGSRRQDAAAEGDSTLVLGGGRFEVEIEWSTAASSGAGRPEALTADTGVFWFFEPENLEVVIKVLDACAFNGRYWVFGGGLTDVEARITVTDTQSSAVREYGNALGVPFQPIRDTSAFECN